jgi:hypothetical protein
VANLQETIANEFLAELAKAAEFDKGKIDQLKALLAGKKKLKPEDLVAVFSLPHGGEIK